MLQLLCNIWYDIGVSWPAALLSALQGGLAAPALSCCCLWKAFHSGWAAFVSVSNSLLGSASLLRGGGKCLGAGERGQEPLWVQPSPPALGWAPGTFSPDQGWARPAGLTCSGLEVLWALALPKQAQVTEVLHERLNEPRPAPGSETRVSLALCVVLPLPAWLWAGLLQQEQKGGAVLARRGLCMLVHTWYHRVKLVCKAHLIFRFQFEFGWHPIMSFYSHLKSSLIKMYRVFPQWVLFLNCVSLSNSQYKQSCK